MYSFTRAHVRSYDPLVRHVHLECTSARGSFHSALNGALSRKSSRRRRRRRFWAAASGPLKVRPREKTKKAAFCSSVTPRPLSLSNSSPPPDSSHPVATSELLPTSLGCCARDGEGTFPTVIVKQAPGGGEGGGGKKGEW